MNDEEFCKKIDMNFMDKCVFPILKERGYEITLHFYKGKWDVSLFAGNQAFIDVEIDGIDDLTEALRQAIEKLGGVYGAPWEIENE